MQTLIQPPFSHPQLFFKAWRGRRIGRCQVPEAGTFAMLLVMSRWHMLPHAADIERIRKCQKMSQDRTKHSQTKYADDVIYFVSETIKESFLLQLTFAASTRIVKIIAHSDIVNQLKILNSVVFNCIVHSCNCAINGALNDWTALAACGLDTKLLEGTSDLQMFHLVHEGSLNLMRCVKNPWFSLAKLNIKLPNLGIFILSPWSLLQGSPLVPDRCLWSWRGVDWRRTSNTRQDKWEDVYIIYCCVFLNWG